MAKSTGMQCVAFDCYSYSYYFKDGQRVSSNISFFCFPDDKSVKKNWCNLIKRRENQDGFKITKSTRVCEKHFLPEYIYRPPGGTKKRLLDGAKPVLHSWNNFTIEEKQRKEPLLRRSPRKKRKLDTAPIQVEDESLKEQNSDSKPLDQHDYLIDFESTVERTVDNSDKQRKTDDNSVQDAVEIKRLKELVKTYEKNMRSHFMDHVLSSDNMCNHYTGFPSVNVLNAVFYYLDAGPNSENVILYNYQKNKQESTAGRPRKLNPFESYVLTLIRLRRNFDISHLAFLYKVSESTVSNTINTWINYMYLRLGSLCIWPSREQIAKLMPESMKEKYPNVRCIIDCVEFKVETPSSLVLHKTMYSDYKSHTTVKTLVGIAPGGGFTFISNSYPGSISDKEIVVKSGFLNPNLWEQGDTVMADRGFLIEDYLKPLGVGLEIPDFLKGREQFSVNETVNSQQIANERIHVERMIQRLKCYHIFDRVIPLNMFGSLNQIITVCAMLSNFQEPILKKKTLK